MIFISFLLLVVACSTEVGLLGYVDKTSDTSQNSNSPLLDDEESPDDTDASTDTNTDIENSGITGYVNYKLRQVACPVCVGESQEISITFSASFHQPSSDGHTEWLPSPGTCTDNLYTISPSIAPTSVGQSIQVDSGTHSFNAFQSGVGSYFTDQIWESQYLRDSLYTGQTSLGSFYFTSSHGFDYIEPYTLLWVDPSYAYDTEIFRSPSLSNDFYWGPTSSDSLFLITVAVYSWDGSQFLGRVDCASNDSGFMSIPGSYFQGFPSGSLAAVHLVRHKIELTETDINNSFIETHTEWEVIGTAHIQ